MFQKKALKQPLLALSSEADQLAALTVWITILRFMGDLPEPKKSSKSLSGSQMSNHELKLASMLQSGRKGATSPLNVDTTPVMARIYSTLGRRYSRHEVEKVAETLSMNLERTLASSVTPSESVQNLEASQLTPSSTSSSSSGKSETMTSLKRTVRKKLISLTLRRKSKVPASVMNSNDGTSLVTSNNHVLPDDRPLSNLDKLHFIIGNGILRPDIRDEVYCQISKQLLENPSRGSIARGWILMSLCLGCFPPSETLLPYLKNLINQHSPLTFAKYCVDRLERTSANGARSQPPSWIELQATKTRRPIAVPVTFMDGSTRSAIVDSASTAREVCDQLADKITLKDRFGFSLYVTLFDKVSSLGSGNDHIFDAVSQCEQYAKEQGAQERNAPWRLFFRKEIFTPWHNPLEDAVATNLIYQQIVRGVKFGEYRCDRESDLAMLAAQQYYIEYGSVEDFNPIRMHQLITSYIPDSNLAASKRAQSVWAQAAASAYQRSYFVREKANPDQVRNDIVNYARYKWPLLFSRFYEAYRLSGPSLPKNEVILAVNWTGVYVIDDQEQVLVELGFPEIMAVSSTQTGKIHGRTINIQSVAGHSFSFTSANAEDVCNLILHFLEGLKKRSKYVLALQEFAPDDSRVYLSPVATVNTKKLEKSNRSQPQLAFNAGDLIALQSNDCGETIQRQQWAVGLNKRTNRLGVFPVEMVHIIPTLLEPSEEIMKTFELFVSRDNREKEMEVDNGSKIRVEINSNQVGKSHTLAKFAEIHFKPLHSNTMKKSGRVVESSLWKHSKEPLKGPLLSKLEGHHEMSQQSIEIFMSMLKYAGESKFKLPTKQTSTRLLAHISEITDQIFQPCLSNEGLVDEVYCQLIKQCTENKHQQTLERYWQLLWLATGLMVPSQTLFREVVTFFKTSYNPENKTLQLAIDCLSRINKTLRHGNRKSAPHEVEIEAVQLRQLQILHRVFLPDGNSDNYEIESTTRAKDLCLVIAKRLNLRAVDGFSLFVKLGEKVVSVPESDFFFDFIRHLTDLMKKNGILVTEDRQYQVFFMRKLWTNVVPGIDTNADAIFHYPQELSKYLRGYHRIGEDDCSKLAGLIYVATYGSDRSYISMIPQFLRDLIPPDMAASGHRKQHEWKQMIVRNIDNFSRLSQSEAKIEFLKIIHKLPTFGSAFFEVRQTLESNLPEMIIVAISRNGVMLIHPKTKEVIRVHSFKEITNWSSGATYFHMTVGSLLRGSKLLFETNLGYKMDDLITSYISVLLTDFTSKHHRLVGPVIQQNKNGTVGGDKQKTCSKANGADVKVAASQVKA